MYPRLCYCERGHPQISATLFVLAFVRISFTIGRATIAGNLVRTVPMSVSHFSATIA